MVIRSTCSKCGIAIKLDFGNLTKEEALAVAERLDNEPRECPGQHMELSGLGRLWRAEDAIHRLYDLGEGEEAEPIESDEEFVSRIVAEGKEVFDGGLNTVPGLGLPSIHDLKNLDHIGFGNFQSDSHVFLRRDSPRGTRFYVREQRGGNPS